MGLLISKPTGKLSHIFVRALLVISKEGVIEKKRFNTLSKLAWGHGSQGASPHLPTVPHPPLACSPAAPTSALAPSSNLPDLQVLVCSLLLVLHLEKEVVRDRSPWAPGGDVAGSRGSVRHVQSLRARWGGCDSPVDPGTLAASAPPGSARAHRLPTLLEPRPTQAVLH